MKKIQQFTGLSLTVLSLALSSTLAVADQDAHDSANYCMDLVIEPFHMIPDGSCTVRDYLDGELQDMFYPFTEQDHLFNCEYFGPLAPLPTGDKVPSSVASEDTIVGTLDGYPFEATLMCASLTNWYQDSCSDPNDPTTCTYQLAQPFLAQGLPYPRVTEVSIFDGVVSVETRKGKYKDIPLIMATRASGITHLESLDPETLQVGASFTHDLLGMVTYDADEMDEDDIEVKVIEASADMLLQGHIFFPEPVIDDPGAARIRGAICSKELYNRLNRQGGQRGKKGRDD
jgi:hypothetical protein